MKWQCSLISALAILLGTVGAFAFPPCSQIDTDFCYPDQYCGSVTIEWRGSCSNNPPDREWRCVWHDCTNPHWEETLYSSWVPCCSGEFCDCLILGTPITLADGRTKPVETIQTGDIVLSFDEASGTMKPGVVVSTHAPFATDHYFVINEKIKMTGGHPILTDGEWVNVDQLKIGDSLTGSGGADLRIWSIHEIEETTVTYNFQVSIGTYVAGGIVVHNKENCEHFMQYPEENPR